MLIPQLENSLRDWLEQQGVIIRVLKRERQEHIGLETILEKAELKKLLGQDTIEDLKGLLIESTYAELRNRLSHGLMHTAQFYSAETIYLWWLILRLCLMPSINCQ